MNRFSSILVRYGQSSTCRLESHNKGIDGENHRCSLKSDRVII
jgi:hypothetical protein